MRIRGPWKVVAFAALFVFVSYPFLAGPLFAWSPVKPGYDVVHLQRADVYFARGQELDTAFRNLDRYIDGPSASTS
jgi:hypothetical protein